MDLDGGLDAGLDGGFDGADMCFGLAIDGDYGGVDFDGDGFDGVSLGNAMLHESGWDTSWQSKTADDKRAFILHVGPHGDVDTKKLVGEVAAKAGFIRLHPKRVSGTPIDSCESYLLPLTAWSKSAPAGSMPSGHYRNATGTTTIWREFFQVGVRDWPWSAPRFDKEAMVHVEISCITWFFRETGDYETRLLFRVVPWVFMCQVSGESGFRKKPLDAHIRAAKRACDLMLGELKATKPHPAAQQLRRRKLNVPFERLALSRPVPQRTVPKPGVLPNAIPVYSLVGQPSAPMRPSQSAERHVPNVPQTVAQSSEPVEESDDDTPVRVVVRLPVRVQS